MLFKLCCPEALTWPALNSIPILAVFNLKASKMPTSSRIGIGQCVEACGQERAWVDDVCQISGVLGLECGFSCRKVHVGGKPRQVPLMDDGEREEGPRRTGGTSSPCGGHSYLHLETWEITLQLEGKARVGPEGQVLS